MRREIFMRDNFCGDISHSEIEVLFFLKEAKISTMKKISEFLKIKPSSVTPVIERLNKRRMLQRIPDKKDRRLIYVSLTKNGIKTLENKRKMVHENLKKLFQKTSKKNKNELIKIINAIAKDYE